MPCCRCRRCRTCCPAGVLYYGDTAANNVRASTYVTDLRSAADLAAFVGAQPDNVLTVVDVSLLRCAEGGAGGGGLGAGWGGRWVYCTMAGSEGGG